MVAGYKKYPLKCCNNFCVPSPPRKRKKQKRESKINATLLSCKLQTERFVTITVWLHCHILGNESV